jgi:hypothetical protein
MVSSKWGSGLGGGSAPLDLKDALEDVEVPHVGVHLLERTHSRTPEADCVVNARL